MKVVLKFAGLIAAGLALIAFILILATPAVVNGNYSFAGANAIFGGSTWLGDYGPTWAGLLAFIFFLIAIIALLVTAILPLVGVKALDNFAGLINLCAAALLIVGGIFCFCIVPAVLGNNTGDSGIGAGWVFAGIFALLGGACAALPGVMKLTSK